MKCPTLLLVAALALTGCAGAKNEDCSTGTCGDAGSGVSIDAPLGSDAGHLDAPLKGFGEPCSDLSQCQSNVCIVIATGGICTEGCGGTSCPSGYGCFAVTNDELGTQDVCVPLTTQLCSPCTADTECTNIGMDKCVTETTGRSFCATDCSSIGCPTGFTCNNIIEGGTNYKECIPETGACDCQTAAQAGGSSACEITTTFNTQCAGTQQCGGTSGWSTCMPPSQTDVPDANYVDDNCDGIDGDITKGIFVSAAGADSATCGLTYTTACQTISYASIRAVQASRPNVYVQAGTYNEVVVLQNGVNLWGGYDLNWVRGPTSSSAHRATVIGKQDTTTGGDSEWLTVRAHGLIVPVTIADLVLQGPDATGTGGTSGLDGKSSYVVHVKGSEVSLVRVEIIAGNGAAGSAGANGTDAATVDAQSYMAGTQGGSGDESTSFCDNSSRGGPGTGGTNTCSGRATAGGAGGAGGTKDTGCDFPDYHFDATAGANGAAASFSSSPLGTGGAGGTGQGVCGLTTDGHQGAVSNGSAGTANTGGYLFNTSAYWYAHAGGSGATGDNGGGGGGGGGAGGCDNGEDSYGAGGGGGGAGGCAARGGGGGGGGGGGSFGIVAVSTATVTISTCTLTRGNGGNGGGGGTGGRGQSGGSAGASNPIHNGGAAPGAGGVGAHGGHGGGGAGGAGGASNGILVSPDSTVTGTCTQSNGAAGVGGAGGASAPNAPMPDRDGNAGGSGGNATAPADSRTCTSVTNC